MLDEKFVAAIAGTAVKAAGASLLSVPNDPRHSFLIQDGKHTLVDLPPAPRAHAVNTIDDVAKWAKENESHLCFHDAHAIVLIEDTDDRHDRVTMTLDTSPQFQAVMSLQAPKKLTQRELITMLRTTFRGCIEPTALAQVRSINFNQQQDGENHIAAGAEKVGKSITAKVLAGNAEPPEEIRLSVPVYTNQGLTQRFPVVLVLDIDVLSQVFTVQTAPGDVETVTNAIAEQIHEKLLSDCPGVRVLRGSVE